MEDKYPILKFFKWQHLPERLQLISQDFCHLAAETARRAPDGGDPCPETEAALRKLLEAKDCAVRAAWDPCR